MASRRPYRTATREGGELRDPIALVGEPEAEAGEGGAEGEEDEEQEAHASETARGPPAFPEVS
jgi:hypothetical protein